MSLYCEYDTLKTESDVEQKFIYQFLTNINPIGLGLGSSDIQTLNMSLGDILLAKGSKSIIILII